MALFQFGDWVIEMCCYPALLLIDVFIGDDFHQTHELLGEIESGRSNIRHQKVNINSSTQHTLHKAIGS
jgi:hypothetical protein